MVVHKVTLHKGKSPDQYQYLRWDAQVQDDIFERAAAQGKKEKNIMVEGLCGKHNRINMIGQWFYYNLSKNFVL